MINTLKNHWRAIFTNHDGLYDELFDTIITFYQEPHRHYHNITHLYECFLWFDKIKDNLYRPDLVAIALFIMT